MPSVVIAHIGFAWAFIKVRRTDKVAFPRNSTNGERMGMGDVPVFLRHDWVV